MENSDLGDESGVFHSFVMAMSFGFVVWDSSGMKFTHIPEAAHPYSPYN